MPPLSPDASAAVIDSGQLPPPNEMQEETTPPEMMEEAPMQMSDGDGDEELSTDKAKLQLLKEELAQTQSSLDADFIKTFQSSLTPDEQELQFGDPSAFLALYEQKKGAFLEEQINSKAGAISELESAIAAKEETLSYKKAFSEFAKNHPDASIEALRDFFQNDMTPRQQEEAAKMPPLEFYEAVYAQFSKSAPSDVKDEEVPLKLEGGFGGNGGAVGGQSPWFRRA